MEANEFPEYSPWHVVREIGAGSYGKVYEIQREDFGEQYKAALKVISIPKNEEEMRTTLREEGLYDDNSASQYYESAVSEVAKEFNLMSKLKGNTNIVSYEDHQLKKHMDGIGWDIFVRMELLTPLSTYVQDRPFYYRDVLRLGIDICTALERCQRYGMIHRDIKPDNIFLSEQGDFKLGDFGVARISEHTVSVMSKTGTPNYMAPEVEKGQAYGSSVDIFSLGVVMYRLLNDDRLPFYPPYPMQVSFQDRQQANIKRLTGEALPNPRNAQENLAKIVLKACAYAPEDRYRNPQEMKIELESVLDGGGERLNLVLNQNLLEQAKKRNSGFSPNGAIQRAFPTDMSEQTGMESESAGTDVFFKGEAIETDEEDKTVSLFEKIRMNQEKKRNENEVITTFEQDLEETLPGQEIDQVDVLKQTDTVSEEGHVPAARGKLRNIKVKYLVTAVLSLILISGTAISIGFQSFTTTLPDVTGMGQEKASQILKSHGLKVLTGQEEYSDTVGEGNVIRVEQDGQKPETGKRLRKNTEISLIVSAGRQYVMEDYIGSNEKEAVEKLEKLALDVDVEREYSEKYASGIIMSQDVAVGETVTKDQIIKFTVSKGTKPFLIKDYSGRTLKAALAYANKNHLTMKIKKVYHSKTEKDIVISQMPKSGTEVVKGDTLSLVVSKGPRLYGVPDLTGKTESQAASVLKKKKLKLGQVSQSYSSTVPAGYIISQSDAAGSRRVKNTCISITVSLGAQPSSSVSSGTSSSSGSSGTSSAYSSSSGYGSSNSWSNASSGSSGTSSAGSAASGQGSSSSSNGNVTHFDEMELVE